MKVSTTVRRVVAVAASALLGLAVTLPVVAAAQDVNGGTAGNIQATGTADESAQITTENDWG